MVWQLVQGASSWDPAFIPWIVSPLTALWHWLHKVLIVGMFSNLAF